MSSAIPPTPNICVPSTGLSPNGALRTEVSRRLGELIDEVPLSLRKRRCGNRRGGNFHILQAVAVHEDVEYYIRKILEKTHYVDKAYKYCSGILNFTRKVGPERLAAACRLADSIGKYNFNVIEDILQNQSERIDLPEEPADMPEPTPSREPSSLF